MDIQDVIEVPQCGVYVKTQAALLELFKYLKEEGYEVEECRRSHQPLTRSEREKLGQPLWFARLRDDVRIQKGKCNSCGSYIRVNGIRTHKHECEACGAYTYLEFTRGGHVRFSFADDEKTGIFKQLEYTIYDYDNVNGRLYLYADPICGKRYDSFSPEEVQQALDRNRSKWELVKKVGRLPRGIRKSIRRLKSRGELKKAQMMRRQISCRYPDHDLMAVSYDETSRSNSDIETYNITGTFNNHSIVTIYDGKEYQFHDSLPVPESFCIYETWHWAPLEPSPRLHERILSAAGMVSRCDYYHQDGRREFQEIHVQRMRLFVEHCTTLNIDEWDVMIENACKSGPGMIKAVAAFCHTGSAVENNPNIGNWMQAVSKIRSRQPLSPDEEEAARAAENDPVIRGQIEDIIASFGK